MKFTHSLMVVVFTTAASVGMASAQHMHDKAAAVDSNSGHQMINAELMHKCMMQDQMTGHEMMREETTKKSSRAQMMKKIVPMGMKHVDAEKREDESGQTTMSNVIRCVMDGASSDPFLNAVIKLFALPVVRTDPELSDEQIANLFSMQERVLDYYDKATLLISEKQDAINAIENDGESTQAEIHERSDEVESLRERQRSFVTEMSRTMTGVLTDDQVESFEAYSIEDVHHFMMAGMSKEEMTVLMRIIHCDKMSADMMHGEGMETMHGEGMEMMHGEGMETMHDGGMEMMKDCPMRAKMEHQPMDGESNSQDLR